MRNFYKRKTTCQLEIDACVEDILNVQEFIQSQQTGVKVVPSLAPLWEEERKRRRERGDANTQFSPSVNPTSRSFVPSRITLNVMEKLKERITKDINEAPSSEGGRLHIRDILTV